MALFRWGLVDFTSASSPSPCPRCPRRPSPSPPPPPPRFLLPFAHRFSLSDLIRGQSSLPHLNHEAEDLPDRTPETMSEDMPERMFDRMSDDVLERRSERMSEAGKNVRQNVKRYAKNVRHNVRRYARDVRQNAGRDAIKMSDRLSEDVPARVPERR